MTAPLHYRQKILFLSTVLMVACQNKPVTKESPGDLTHFSHRTANQITYSPPESAYELYGFGKAEEFYEAFEKQKVNLGDITIGPVEKRWAIPEFANIDPIIQHFCQLRAGDDPACVLTTYPSESARRTQLLTKLTELLPKFDIVTVHQAIELRTQSFPLLKSTVTATRDLSGFFIGYFYDVNMIDRSRIDESFYDLTSALESADSLTFSFASTFPKIELSTHCSEFREFVGYFIDEKLKPAITQCELVEGWLMLVTRDLKSGKVIQRIEKNHSSGTQLPAKFWLFNPLDEWVDSEIIATMDRRTGATILAGNHFDLHGESGAIEITATVFSDPPSPPIRPGSVPNLIHVFAHAQRIANLVAAATGLENYPSNQTHIYAEMNKPRIAIACYGQTNSDCPSDRSIVMGYEQFRPGEIQYKYADANLIAHELAHFVADDLRRAHRIGDSSTVDDLARVHDLADAFHTAYSDEDCLGLWAKSNTSRKCRRMAGDYLLLDMRGLNPYGRGEIVNRMLNMARQLQRQDGVLGEVRHWVNLIRTVQVVEVDPGTLSEPGFRRTLENILSVYDFFSQGDGLSKDRWCLWGRFVTCQVGNNCSCE